MRQAIVTKYLGPTNHRGARIVAKAQAGRLAVPWEDAWDVDANHAYAARMLAERYGWTEHSTLAGGALPDDTGYCFVLISKEGKQA